MYLRTVLPAVAAVVAAWGTANAGLASERSVAGEFDPFDGDVKAVCPGPGGAPVVNATFDVVNMTGQAMCGASFSIIPASVETDDYGEFRRIVFDLDEDSTEDEAPWVPPSLDNPFDFVIEGSDIRLHGPQTMTHRVRNGRLEPGETLHAKLQIDLPPNRLFDIIATPIFPTAGSATLLAVAGLIGLRPVGQRRRGQSHQDGRRFGHGGARAESNQRAGTDSVRLALSVGA
jgi:hypothetical protein